MIRFVVLCLAVATVNAAILREGGEFPCEEDPSRCFFMSSKPMKYDEAVNFCRDNGEGKLVTFMDEKKYQTTMTYVRNQLDRTQQNEDWIEFFWTGMKYETDDGNAEISAELEGYTLWYPGKPTKLIRHPQYTKVSIIIDQDGDSYYQGMANVPDSYVYLAVCQTTEF